MVEANVRDNSDLRAHQFVLEPFSVEGIDGHTFHHDGLGFAFAELPHDSHLLIHVGKTSPDNSFFAAIWKQDARGGARGFAVGVLIQPPEDGGDVAGGGGLSSDPIHVHAPWDLVA